jgi:predicted acetyltransferase
MAEVFVLKAHRRRGAGTEAFAQITALHPGDWHLGVITRNTGAVGFWARTLEGRGGQTRAVDFDGEDWAVTAFSAG